MTSRANRTFRTCLRDMLIGAMVFALLPGLVHTIRNPDQGWATTDAMAGELIAARAVDVTAPPGPEADNAIVAAAQLRPSADPTPWRSMSMAAVLCLSFSLMVAFNLAFLRHLRRVSASTRRDKWRRRH